MCISAHVSYWAHAGEIRVVPGNDIDVLRPRNGASDLE